ncbi:unnamed protein product [Fusarium equiseti]|uniref:Uncharacterized protein n=1 Tax=Fusarium equiseti TaxID=61235 RepID=A0A8J2IKF8_FUSEQ|nr:unnamed protein product [Fusarium equiseti]
MSSDNGFQQGGFRQTGFQDGGFQQGGFQQSGFQPTGFQQEGFKPTSGKGADEVRVQGSDVAALRKAIDAAKARIEEVDELIKKLEFLPVATNDPGLSNSGF